MVLMRQGSGLKFYYDETLQQSIVENKINEKLIIIQ